MRFAFGEVAQLVEHHVRNVGVESSNLFFSTKSKTQSAFRFGDMAAPSLTFAPSVLNCSMSLAPAISAVYVSLQQVGKRHRAIMPSAVRLFLVSCSYYPSPSPRPIPTLILLAMKSINEYLNNVFTILSHSRKDDYLLSSLVIYE